MRPYRMLRQIQSRFWETSDVAGPTAWDVLRVWDRSPRYMRSQPRQRPAPLDPFSAPTRLLPADAADLASFWSAEYRGDDWKLIANADWVRPLLQDPNNLILAAEYKGEIVGTAACIQIGPARMGTTTFPILFVIEGLCIAPAWRGRHLAGWLIAWLDHLMNQGGPKAYLWSRETPVCTDISYISSHTYGYIDTTKSAIIDRDGLPVLAAVPQGEFKAAWATAARHWDASHSLFPTSIRSPLHVWRCGETYLVLADTRRISVPARAPIWEVVWCGGLADPFAGAEDARRMLETLIVEGAFPRGALLFCTSAPYQGGITRHWPRPWVFGTAGVHTTYLYNFMPPAFHTLRVLLPRVDL